MRFAATPFEYMMIDMIFGQRAARASSVAAVILLLACGDDEGSTGGGGTDPGTTSASTTSTVSSASTAGSTTAMTTGGGSCAPDDVLDPLSQFIDAMNASAGLVAGLGFAGEAVAFLQAPGLPSPPALSGSFAGLFMPCSMPVLFEPFCDQGRCSRLECPVEGSDWINHLYLEASPFSDGGFTFDGVLLDVRWSEGSRGVTYDLEVESTDPGDRVWNMTASGAITETTWSFDGVLPSVVETGEATLTIDGAREVTATLTIGDTVVAEGVPLVATGACP